MPDGRVAILGGWENPPDGGPIELFDPEDPTAGFQLGPNMKYPRGYHSSAILMPDGSIVVGGDPDGADDAERALPAVVLLQAPPADHGSPAAIGYGQTFQVQTPQPSAIAEVVLMRPGAVTHGFNQNQRSVGCVISGATAPRSLSRLRRMAMCRHPGTTLLFVVDHDRTPSQGVWVRLS